MFQDLLIDGAPLYRHVADAVEGWAQQSAGQCGYGAVGAVVGATYPDQLVELRRAMPHAWLLVPGYGSQGAAAPTCAGRSMSGAWGRSSTIRGRSFLPTPRKEYQQFGPARWQRAVEAATREMIDQLRAETAAGKLTGGAA